MWDKNCKNLTINVNVTDVVLTPSTCAVLVNEILKYLVYQKSQIPYPYNWLQNVVTRKRSTEKKNEQRTNYSVANNFRVASAAYDTLEEIMKNVNLQFIDSGDKINEIVIIFGITQFSPKEIIRIVLPNIEMRHLDKNHAVENHRNQHKVLRDIFLCEDWVKAMEFIYPITNMHVLVNNSEKISIEETSFFLPLRDYTLNENVRHTAIVLLYKNQQVGLCCLDLQIYVDEDQKEMTVKFSGNEKNEEALAQLGCHWYHARSIFKGYKDCIINKRSATDFF